ncbi:Glutamate receptor 2.7 [Sesamum alatum]|uniref:Glutamate receptor n=1 Tax=Sesamum alatum TaxID=300844 RepID=A0AAE2CMB7_9LAMI|nr:Glutamate receptor 2.7 [Sesamum alatum]
MSFCIAPLNGQNATAVKADVGIILDYDTTVGKISKTCLSMALEDFYAKRNHSTMIVPHFRDSYSDVVGAASAAIDLLRNVEVMAIIGPQKSIQADFVIDIGDKVRVPIISQATSPALSPKESPYFIRPAQCSSYQAEAIAAIVKAFGWRQVVFIYEDTNYGSGLVQFLTEGLRQNNALVSYQSVISPSATNDQILLELYKLTTMQTRVFVVHMLPSLASRFFKMAKASGMMSEGNTWIIADALTSLLDSVDSETIEAMQGVIGVKAYIPRSNELDNFTRRWRKRFHKENPEMDRTELNVFGLWAYDSITALALAIERSGMTSPRFKKPASRGSLTDLAAIGISSTGPSFVPLIRNFSSKGLSGDFSIIDGQLLPSAFQIVNVIGKGEYIVGFWTKTYGISRKLKPDDDKAVYSTNKDRLGAILWPGQTAIVPKGWEMPTSGKKLRVGVPVKSGFTEFVKIERDAETNAVIPTGFCIDVFKEVMQSLPYAVLYEFFPFETPDGQSAGEYNDLVYRIYLEEYDAVVGDIAILANRSRFVDFSFPYTESGVSTIVPIKDNERKNAWIFMKPLTTDLWLTIGAFFVFTGFVVWVLEHRINKEFRGPRLQQVGMIFWFSFSTLVFAHKEKVISNLTRFVVIVWVFVVLVLTSSYTANLTSMLTVQQLQPTITDLHDLIKTGDYIGYQDASFVREFLRGMDFDTSKFRNYSTLQDYDDALSKGSKNGGVAAIVDELPYLRLFLDKYSHKYVMVGPTYKTAGFGFAFRKGSPLVPDVSRAILEMREGGNLMRISNKWLGEEGCRDNDATVMTSKSLTLDSFKGLFLIAGLSSSSALAIFLCIFFYENRVLLASDASIKQKLSALARVFDEKEILSSKASRTPTPRGAEAGQSPAISISYQHEEVFSSQDEGFSTTEPGTPIHHNAIGGAN